MALTPLRSATNRVRLAVLAALLSCGTAAFAEPSAKPPVPPGRDPGGSAIAVIGTGLDYTRPELAARLARDGEGEIVGFDLVDQDRKPFAKPDGPSGSCGDIGCNALPAHLALAEGQAVRLAVFRADVSGMRSLAGAIGFVAKSPARIVLIDSVAPPAVLAAAAERFPALIFVAPAPDPAPAAAARAPLANVMLVRDAARAEPTAAAVTPAADIATPASGRALSSLAKCPETGCPMEVALADRLAAARIAALAARLLAVEPGLDGAAMKERIVKLAAEPSPAAARSGFIAEPQKPFWLE